MGSNMASRPSNLPVPEDAVGTSADQIGQSPSPGEHVFFITTTRARIGRDTDTVDDDADARKLGTSYATEYSIVGRIRQCVPHIVTEAHRVLRHGGNQL